MPWLVKNENNDENLLLVHVPRCGGTSLIKYFGVEKKSHQGVDCYHKAGLIYFFYRYRLLEKANFPFRSYENLYALFVFLTAWIIFFIGIDYQLESCEGNRWCPSYISISFWSSSLFTFFLSTFIMVAAIMARIEYVRRFTMYVFGKILCGFGSSTKYLHGVSHYGYLMHFTAEKMVRHRFIERNDLAHSFAIVRNPYSRMVSIYGYNRYGRESFKHFVKSWYKKYLAYKRKNSTECWDVYCHVLPMHEYTHNNGEQYVPNVIKQEHLKYITGKEEKTEISEYYKFLPKKIMDALKNMPHTNKRKPKKKWQDMYTQETMDMVLEMYKDDFLQFSYDMRIPNRLDLIPKFDLENVSCGTAIKPMFTEVSSFHTKQVRKPKPPPSPQSSESSVSTSDEFISDNDFEDIPIQDIV